MHGEWDKLNGDGWGQIDKINLDGWGWGKIAWERMGMGTKCPCSALYCANLFFPYDFIAVSCILVTML